MAYYQKDPLVSIIIPFYNAAPFISATLESVLAQTYTHWEILLVDDGSSDNSYQIAKLFAQEHPQKIFLFTHENHSNKGAAASRNLGFAKSSGELITFLDSDDLWLPEKLQTQVQIMMKNQDIDVLCEATKYWNSWFDATAKDYIIPIGAPADQLYQPPRLAAQLYPLGIGDSFCTCALMVQRKAFLEVEGFEESFTGTNQLFEDQTFFLKICLTQSVFLSSICNNIYRQRPNSLMHGLISNGHHDEALHHFLKWLQNFINQKSIQDAEINSLLKKSFLPYQYPILYSLLNTGRRIGSKVKRKLRGFVKQQK